MKFEIRKAVEKDLKKILDFNQELFNYEYENFDKTLNCGWSPRNEDYFRKSIDDDDCFAWVAVAEGELVGYLIGKIKTVNDCRKVKSVAEIDNVFVDRRFRSKGIGSELCKVFFGWAKEKNIDKLRVESAFGNKGAIALYRKMGFMDYNLILERDT